MAEPGKPRQDTGESAYEERSGIRFGEYMRATAPGPAPAVPDLPAALKVSEEA